MFNKSIEKRTINVEVLKGVQGCSTISSGPPSPPEPPSPCTKKTVTSKSSFDLLLTLITDSGSCASVVRSRVSTNRVVGSSSVAVPFGKDLLANIPQSEESADGTTNMHCTVGWRTRYMCVCVCVCNTFQIHDMNLIAFSDPSSERACLMTLSACSLLQ